MPPRSPDVDVVDLILAYHASYSLAAPAAMQHRAADERGAGKPSSERTDVLASAARTPHIWCGRSGPVSGHDPRKLARRGGSCGGSLCSVQHVLQHAGTGSMQLWQRLGWRGWLCAVSRVPHSWLMEWFVVERWAMAALRLNDCLARASSQVCSY